MALADPDASVVPIVRNVSWERVVSHGAKEYADMADSTTSAVNRGFVSARYGAYHALVFRFRLVFVPVSDWHVNVFCTNGFTTCSAAVELALALALCCSEFFVEFCRISSSWEFDKKFRAPGAAAVEALRVVHWFILRI